LPHYWSVKIFYVIKDANIVAGNPVVTANNPSRSIEIEDAVSELFGDEVRAIIVRNHGVVSAGKDIHHARTVIESLKEWAKVLTVSIIVGGPKDFL